MRTSTTARSIDVAVVAWGVLLVVAHASAHADLRTTNATGLARTPTSGGCKSFEPGGRIRFDCAIETPEHYLVRKYVPRNATVIEFGARFGTTTCVLAEATHNSGALVAVEPDANVWPHLERNLIRNQCAATVLTGVIGSGGMKIVPGGGGYANRVEVDETAHNFISMAALQRRTSLVFDTLLVDCEGCMRHMRDQLDPLITSGQITRVIVEADMPCWKERVNCMNYEPWFAFLRKQGFEKLVEFNECWDWPLFFDKAVGKLSPRGPKLAKHDPRAADIKPVVPAGCQWELNHSAWVRVRPA